MRAIFSRCIPPAQAIAIDEDNPTQHPSVIDPWLAVRLREERRKVIITAVARKLVTIANALCKSRQKWVAPTT